MALLDGFGAPSLRDPCDARLSATSHSCTARLSAASQRSQAPNSGAGARGFCLLFHEPCGTLDRDERRPALFATLTLGLLVQKRLRVERRVVRTRERQALLAVGVE